MEVLILGDSIDSPAFVALLHRTLRALIDQLGVDSFNVGVLNMGPPGSSLDPRFSADLSSPLLAQTSISQSQPPSRESSFTESSTTSALCDAAVVSSTTGRGRESEGSSLEAGATADFTGVADVQTGVERHGNEVEACGEGGLATISVGDEARGGECGAWRPVFARVVSRGHGPASDFGTLEVVGGASIGHTDPYRVIAAIRQQL